MYGAVACQIGEELTDQEVSGLPESRPALSRSMPHGGGSMQS